jgi:hypothetical protein
MQEKNINEMTTASSAVPSESITTESIKKAVDSLRWKPTDFDFNRMFVNEIDFELLAKEKLKKKYPIDKYGPPVPDMYFGVDVAASQFVPRHQVVLYDKSKNKIVGIIDFTPKWIKMLEAIKKFFKSLWFKIIRRNK